jgi:hypothetical protein
MADEKPTGNNPANPGNNNANKDAGKSNRRRSLRSKRRGRKPEEASESRESRESRAPREQRAQPNNAPKAAEKSIADNRDRRRRRRMRAKQRGQSETTTTTVAPVVENTFKDLPPLVPAFVYTHVLRPSIRDSFEFRTEHFSKVTRKMEDFHIDLSPLYPDGGDEIKGVGYMPPLEHKEGDDIEEEEEGDVFEDPDWDAEESGDALLLDGAIADDFYDNLDDSVIDVASVDDVDTEELP